MNRFAICLMLGLTVIGCTSTDPTEAERETCTRAGHAPGTEAYDACIQELLAQRFQRPAASNVDTMRTRMGPRR